MADFTTINQEIDNNIKQNGVNAITGQKLNTVLKDMMSAVNTEKQDTIDDLAEIRTGAEAGAAAYQMPEEGIPSRDLSEGVQKSLENADNAVLYEEQSTKTDQQRNTALANVSNQTANSTTGKMGYKVLDPTKTFASQVTAENTIYEIRDVFDLNNGSVTIPAGSVLKNNGGILKNCTVTLNNTSIQSDTPIFGDGVVVTGNALQEASTDWFTGSDADKIERAIEAFGVVRLSARDYLIDRQIEVTQSFKLSGSAFADFFGEGADAPGIRRDMSSTRLVATDAFNATATESYTPAIIKVCRGGTNQYFYSIHIENVSFLGKNKVGYGIEICTPNGPSRPISIIGCNFKEFDHAIDINNDGLTGTSDSPTSTNVGVFSLENSNVTNNNYGIYVSGHHALILADIKNNNLEVNTYGAIYAMDSTIRENGTPTYPLYGNINIENNLLEGQPNPLSLRTQGSIIRIVGNYFERGAGQLITLEGLYYYESKAIINGNTASTDVLRIKSSGVDIVCDNGDYILDLNTLVYEGAKPNKLQRAVSVLFKDNPSNSSVYTEIGNVYPTKDYIIDGDYLKKYVGLVADSYLVALPIYNVAQSLDAGRYRMITKVVNGSIDNKLGLRISTYAEEFPNLKKTEEPMYYVSDVVLDEAVTSAFFVRIKSQYPSAAVYTTDIVVVKVPSETPYLIPSLPLDLHNVNKNNILSPKGVGDKLFDTTLGKTANWDGKKWADSNGYTANLSKGTTAERPTDLFGFEDDGYPYFDTDLYKEIYLKSEVGTRLISQVVSGQGELYIPNTCTEGETYRASLSVNVSYGKVLSFRKSADSADGEIVIFDTSNKDIIVDFRAPSATEYPYIYMYNDRPSGSNQTFYIDNVVKSWIDSTGATV